MGENHVCDQCGSYLPGMEIIESTDKTLLLRSHLPDSIEFNDGSAILNNMGDVAGMVVKKRSDGLLLVNRSEYLVPHLNRLLEMIELAKENGEGFDDGNIMIPSPK